MGQDFVADAVLILGFYLSVLEWIFGVFYGNAPGCPGYVQQGKERVGIVDHGRFSGRFTGNDFDLGIVVQDASFLPQVIEIEQERKVAERMVESESNDADEKKVLIASFHSFLNGVDGIGIIFFAGQNDGFDIEMGVLVRIKIPHDKVRLHRERFEVLQAAVTENEKIIFMQAAMNIFYIIDVGAADNDTAFHLFPRLFQRQASQAPRLLDCLSCSFPARLRKLTRHSKNFIRLLPEKFQAFYSALSKGFSWHFSRVLSEN